MVSGQGRSLQGVWMPLADMQLPWPTGFPSIQGGIFRVQSKWPCMGREPSFGPSRDLVMVFIEITQCIK